MASISSASTANAQPGAQLSALQFKLQQARQEAARAENNLASLQDQTEQAQQEVDYSQRNVQALQGESQQARTEASGSRVVAAVSQAQAVQAKSPSPATSAYLKLADDANQFGFRLQSKNAQLFVNAQGQSTGRILSAVA
jgi:chromosome segregation ATPase